MTSLTRKEPYTMPKTYHTKATQEIEQYLSLQKDKSFCVADVYHYLESNNVDVNQSTVYRTLDRMTDNGVLVRLRQQAVVIIIIEYQMSIIIVMHIFICSAVSVERLCTLTVHLWTK